MLEEFIQNPPDKILLYPNPILLQVAATIMNLEPWKKIVPVMFDIMKKNAGCGLAAPQVGLSYRMFVINITKPMVIINPEIIEVGNRFKEIEERCLSIPGQTFGIKRPTKVKMKWIDLNGNKITSTFEGWTGRAFQHEYDHLDGKLINQIKIQ